VEQPALAGGGYSEALLTKNISLQVSPWNSNLSVRECRSSMATGQSGRIERSGCCSVAGNLSFEVATSQPGSFRRVRAGDKKGTRLGRVARAVAVRFAHADLGRRERGEMPVCAKLMPSA
jgi:hypothetical protein